VIYIFPSSEDEGTGGKSRVRSEWRDKNIAY
jgi:hypothetical protein